MFLASRLPLYSQGLSSVRPMRYSGWRPIVLIDSTISDWIFPCQFHGIVLKCSFGSPPNHRSKCKEKITFLWLSCWHPFVRFHYLARPKPDLSRKTAVFPSISRERDSKVHSRYPTCRAVPAVLHGLPKMVDSRSAMSVTHFRSTIPIRR